MKTQLLLLLFLPFLTFSLFAQPLPYFTMDDPSGSTVNSATDNTMASAQGSVLFEQPGVVGNSVALDGTDYLLLNSSINLPAADDFSIAVWIHPNILKLNSHSQAAIICGSTGSNHYIRLQTDSIALKWDGVTKTVSLNPVFTTNSWQHLAIVKDSGNVTIYRNGVVAGTTSHAREFAFDAIGAKNISGTANYFQGNMDEFQIYQGSALSLSEVQGIASQNSDQVAFSLMGCGPYNHPLNANGSINTNNNSFWTALPFYNTANAQDYYLRRDDGALISYLNREASAIPRSAFIAHLGDIFTGKRKDWPAERYEDVANLLKTSQIPVFASIGDNEWMDHDLPATAEAHWDLHFNRFSDQFPAPSFGSTIGYQPTYEKNFSFLIDDVIFAGLTIPSGIAQISNWLDAVSANRDWLERHLPPALATPANHWTFDDTNTTALDSAGGNHGTFANLATNQTAKIGTGYQFNGTNDITLNSAVSIAASEDFSITVWVKPETLVNGANNPGAILLGEVANNNFLRIDPADVHFKANGTTRTLPIPAGTFTSGEWQHFALIRSQGMLAVYRNGVLLAADGLYIQPFTFTRIGSKNAVQYYDGCLDDLRIYKGTALGRREINALALKTAYWKMDEANGNTLADAFGVTPATSPNGATLGTAGQVNNGVLLNGAADLELSQPIGFSPEDDFTIAAWVRPDTVSPLNQAAPSTVFIGAEDSSSYVRLHDDIVRVKLDGSYRNIPVSPSFVGGQWQHIAITRTDGLLNVYRDGIQVGSVTPGSSAGATFDRIGSKNGDQYFDGLLDELILENHAASPAEVHLLMGDKPSSAVIMAQGSYATPGKYGLVAGMMERSASNFKDSGGLRPILFAQADLHIWVDSKTTTPPSPIPSNMRYLVINSIDSQHPPTQVTVTGDRSPDDAFIFNRRGSPATGSFLTTNDWAPTTDQLGGFEVWLTNYPSLANASPTDDPEGDQFNHFLEYAFGGNPLQPDAATICPNIRGGNQLHFKRAAPDLDYQLQTSTDLTNWSTSTNSATDAGDGTFFINIPNGGDVQFIRLKVGP